jgi:hypothetical protein
MESEDRDPNELLEALERGAIRPAAELSRTMGEELMDVVGALEDRPALATASPDATLGGYMTEHKRPAAFEGSDGQPYTVDLDIEPTGQAGREFAAFFVFVRWAETGAGIMAHVESGDVAFGATEDDARRAALELSLYEVKAELDNAIDRKRADLEE